MTVSAVTSDYDRQLLYQMMTPHIIILQAFIRGFLLRRAYKMRLEYLNRQTDSALTIQVVEY